MKRLFAFLACAGLGIGNASAWAQELQSENVALEGSALTGEAAPPPPPPAANGSSSGFISMAMECDRDGDGKLDRNELEEVAKRLPPTPQGPIAMHVAGLAGAHGPAGPMVLHVTAMPPHGALQAQAPGPQQVSVTVTESQHIAHAGAPSSGGNIAIAQAHSPTHAPGQHPTAFYIQQVPAPSAPGMLMTPPPHAGGQAPWGGIPPHPGGAAPSHVGIFHAIPGQPSPPAALGGLYQFHPQPPVGAGPRPEGPRREAGARGKGARSKGGGKNARGPRPNQRDSMARSRDEHGPNRGPEGVMRRGPEGGVGPGHGGPPPHGPMGGPQHFQGSFGPHPMNGPDAGPQHGPDGRPPQHGPQAGPPQGPHGGPHPQGQPWPPGGPQQGPQHGPDGGPPQHGPQHGPQAGPPQGPHGGPHPQGQPWPPGGPQQGPQDRPFDMRGGRAQPGPNESPEQMADMAMKFDQDHDGKLDRREVLELARSFHGPARNSEGPNRMRRSDNRGPDNPGPDNRGPDHRGPDNRGPDNRGPDNPGPDNRGPDHRGPDNRGPDNRGPEDHGPEPRE